jgi:hypothetical protein
VCHLGSLWARTDNEMMKNVQALVPQGCGIQVIEWIQHLCGLTAVYWAMLQSRLRSLYKLTDQTVKLVPKFNLDDVTAATLYFLKTNVIRTQPFHSNKDMKKFKIKGMENMMPWENVKQSCPCTSLSTMPYEHLWEWKYRSVYS